MCSRISTDGFKNYIDGHGNNKNIVIYFYLNSCLAFILRDSVMFYEAYYALCVWTSIYTPVSY